MRKKIVQTWLFVIVEKQTHFFLLFQPPTSHETFAHGKKIDNFKFLFHFFNSHLFLQVSFMILRLKLEKRGRISYERARQSPLKCDGKKNSFFFTSTSTDTELYTSKRERDWREREIKVTGSWPLQLKLKFFHRRTLTKKYIFIYKSRRLIFLQTFFSVRRKKKVWSSAMRACVLLCTLEYVLPVILVHRMRHFKLATHVLCACVYMNEFL